jgi:hypothetical protein
VHASWVGIVSLLNGTSFSQQNRTAQLLLQALTRSDHAHASIDQLIPEPVPNLPCEVSTLRLGFQKLLGYRDRALEVAINVPVTKSKI